MQVSYIVSMELPDDYDPASIQDVAMDIEEELVSSGFEIISVAPWARPALGLEPEGEDTLPLF